MKNQPLFKCLIFASVAFLSSSAWAGASPNSITYEGVLTDSSGNPVDLSSQTAAFKITNSASCVLYSETSSPAGDSSGNISHAVGTGSATFGSFNSSIFNSAMMGSGSCAVTATEQRYLTVSIDSLAISANIPISSVPYALESNAVGGYSPNSLLKTDSSVSDAGTFNLAQFTELGNLIAGTSTQYVKSSSTTGASVPSLASDPTVSPSNAGSVWYDSNTKVLKYSDGSTVKTVSTGSFTVSNNASLTNGSLWIGNSSGVATERTLSGDISMGNTGTTTITTGAVNSTKILDGTIVDADISSSAGIVDSKLATITTPGKISITTVNSGNSAIQVAGVGTGSNGLMFSGISGIGVNLGGVTAGGTGISYGSVTASTTPTWGGSFGTVSTTGSSAAYGLYFSSVDSTTGTGSASGLTLANVRASASSGQARGVEVISTGTNATGIYSSASSGAVAISASASNSDTAISVPSGRVGIGTMAPSQALDVNGSIHISGQILADGSVTAPAYAGQNSATTGMYFPSFGKISFASGNSDRMVIDSTGSVGIGTAVPLDKLHVVGNIRVDGTVASNIVDNSSAGTTINFASTSIITQLNCPTNITGLHDGGRYTLIVTGSGVLCSFSNSTFSDIGSAQYKHSQEDSTSTTGITIYQILRVGNYIYVNAHAYQ